MCKSDKSIKGPLYAQKYSYEAETNYETENFVSVTRALGCCSLNLTGYHLVLLSVDR